MKCIIFRFLMVLVVFFGSNLCAMEREEGPRKGKEEEIEEQKVPRSLIVFLQENIAKLREGSADESLVARVVSWINNNEVNVRDRFLLDYLPNDIDLRISYAIIRSPYVLFPPEALNFFLNRLPGAHLRERDEIRMRELFSMHLLFTPFNLHHVLNRWSTSSNLQTVINLNEEIEKFKKAEELTEQEKAMLKKFADPMIDELFALKKSGALTEEELKNLMAEKREMIESMRASMQASRRVKFLAATKNLDLIRAILFLARYSEHPSFNDLEEFKKDTATLTGNETTPNGTTGLMIAVGGGYLELVRELLKRGANPFQANHYGDNAFSILRLQLHRAAIDQDFEQQAIYEQIQQLLDEYVPNRAKAIEDLIGFLMLEHEVANPDGTYRMVQGFPYDLARHTVMYTLSAEDRQYVMPSVGRITQERLAQLRAEPTLLERLRIYLPAGILTALSSIIFTRSSNP